MVSNLGMVMRVLYVAAGVGLGVASFLIEVSGWPRWIMFAVGIVAILEGVVGY